MKTRFVSFVATILSLVAMLVSTTAFAGPATDIVKAKQTDMFKLLKDGSADSKKKLEKIFDEMLDYDAVTKASLGSEYAGLKDEEKKQVTELLTKLLRKAYTENLKKTLDFDISYTGEDTNGTVVKTEAKPKAGGDIVKVNYTLAQNGGSWKVVDISPEEVSLVSSWRSQFTKIIKKDGFPALIKKMQDKLAAPSP